MKINIKQHLFALLAMPVLALVTVGAVGSPAYASTTSTGCSANSAATGGINGAADCARGQGSASSLFGDGGSDGGIFRTIANVLLFIIGAISVIMLIIGGIRYTISQGDSAAVTSAKNTILYAVIGIVVAILAYAIVNFVIGSLTAGSSS